MWVVGSQTPINNNSINEEPIKKNTGDKQRTALLRESEPDLKWTSLQK